MGGNDEETLRVYVEECLEHLASIEQDLLQIEKDGAEIDEELVNKVFRAAHSIKGGAGFIGLQNIKELSHKMESVLGLIRNRKLVPNPEVINILLLASDTLKRLVSNTKESDQTDISSHLEALESVMVGSRPEACKKTDSRDDTRSAVVSVEDLGLVLSVPEKDLSRARAEGKNIYLVKICGGVNGEALDEPAIGKIMDRLQSYGVVLASKTEEKPAVSLPQVSQKILYVLFGCVLEPEDVPRLLDADKKNIYWVDADLKARSLSRPHKTDSQKAPAAEARPVRIQPASEPPAKLKVKAFAPTTSTSIRVNVNLLESLINLAGELVLCRNQLLQAISSEDERKIELVGQRIDTITSELQEAIMLTRMQPIGRLFDKFPRAVRDMARELGKEVELEISGREVELDRSLLEAINDPLTHLVRNAIDHGIEAPDVRKRAGKGEAGRIRLSAFHEAGQVVIHVSDDGIGLDPDKLVSIALAKGFITQQQAQVMSTKEKINLIFLPGFSAAKRVSKLSGRGVGMDVVKSNLDRLGGQIDIKSRIGMGTTVRIKLPLTLAIIAGQIIAVENQRYAIPQANLEELLRIPAAQVQNRIEVVGEAPVLRLRGELLPVVRLADVLGMKRTYMDTRTRRRKNDRRWNIADRRSPKWDLFGENLTEKAAQQELERKFVQRSGKDRRYSSTSALNIAVVSTGLMKYGLVVDAFLDSEEIVVKPLGRHLKDSRIYAGATIMGDGRVALILDVGNLAKEAQLACVQGTPRAAQLAREAEERAAETEKARWSLLLFRGAPDEHFAVPLHEVIRIEKIRSKDIQSIGKKRVIQYRGKNLPLFSLEEVADTKPLPDLEHLVVIVFEVAGRECGLLASGPLDTAETEAKIDESTLKQPAITGTVVIDDRITLIVDIYDLVRTLLPEWFSGLQDPGSLVEPPATLLVVEDSRFFRELIKDFFEAEGFSLVEAEDGEVAWKVLQEQGDVIDLVVTDLEMPNCDGFTFTERIRKDERFSGLPVIALTTLAEDEDIERGREIGIDDYQIKLDKERLIASVRKLLKRRQDT